jgi:hypothetical protein
MNRLTQKLVYGTTAMAIFYGAGYGAQVVTEAMMGVSMAEQNAETLACASQLDNRAMQGTVLPPECAEFQAERFSYQQTNVRSYDSAERFMHDSIGDRIYTIPSAEEFREVYLITPDQEARKQMIRHGLAGGIGFIAGAVTLVFTGRRREE